MKRWPLNKAYFWQTAPFFRPLLPFIAGIACSFTWHMPSNVSVRLLTIVILFCFSGYVVVSLSNKQPLILKCAGFLFLNAFLFFMGSMLCLLHDIRHDPSWFGHSIAGSDAFAVYLKEEPVQKDNTYKLPVEVIYSVRAGKVQPVTGGSLLYVYNDGTPLPLHKGDTVLVRNNWQLITNKGNPFEFDYAGYCALNNLFYRQTVPVNDLLLSGSGSSKNITIIDRVHDWSVNQLNKYLPRQEANGLIRDMLIGDDNNLDPQLLQAYSSTGIVHIISISGGNVALFFTFIACLLWWLRNKKHLWIKYLVSLPVIWFYVLMAGSAPSAIRAAVMFTLITAGIVLEKENNNFNLLFATAFLLLSIEPVWLMSLGFQLSFLAVLSLLAFYKHIYKLYSPAFFIIKKLWQVIVASIAAEILVAPLVIYYFHLFPLFFIVANVLAFLFMEFILLLAMVMIGFSFFPPVARFLGGAITFIVNGFDQFVYSIQHLNPAGFSYLRLDKLELFFVGVIIYGLSLFFIKKNKRGLFMGLTASCTLLFAFCRDEWSALGQKKLVIYNMGIPHIELIYGKQFSVIYGDMITLNNKYDYILKPAHTMWQSWHLAVPLQKELFLLGGNTVLILSNPVSGTTPFHVDQIILTGSLKKFDLQAIQMVFTPGTITFCSRDLERFDNDYADKKNKYKPQKRKINEAIVFTNN